MEGAVGDTSNDNDGVPPNTNDVSSEPLAQEPQDVAAKKSKNRNKRDDKNLEEYMKSLNFIPSNEEKFAIVCKQYIQCADDNKKLKFYIKQSDKRHVLLEKSKEHLQQEFNKSILVKSKLENLCRELQKQNKAIKEESLVRNREEEERRKETQAKFQNTLSDITALLEQNNEKNAKLRDDNINMSEKFKSIMQQVQLREQQVDKMSKQMALESQLSEAKLQKANLEHQAEKERLLVDLKQLTVTSAQYKAKVMELQSTEAALKGQLSIYTDKYDEFQTALLRSNEVFGGFKEQMEMMSKKIKKLEKESLSWKKRWETSQTALLEMCSERQASEERASTSMRQLLHMQNLSRTLQAERTILLNTLKEHNIERPPLPVAPLAAHAPEPAPAPSPVSNSKVDAMVVNCAQLRQSLAHLQSQLNDMTNKNDTKEESAKVEKLKSKLKKNKAETLTQINENDQVVRPNCDESNVHDISNGTEPSADESETSENKINTSENKMNETAAESITQVISMTNMNYVNLN